MRKLVSIVTIATAEPIADSDRLDMVTMKGKGWRVVTGRGEFKPGDTAVYFEIDSALPADDERYAFLRDRCLRSWTDKHGRVLMQAIRIRTVKMRGVISQGLVMPVSLFPELAAIMNGEDEDDILRVRHFDDIDAEMRAALDTSRPQGFGRREGNFPSWIPKTDEERIQNLADWPDTLKGILWEVTEKADGSSMTVFWAPSMRPDRPFGVCSRNFELERDETNAWWEAAAKYGIEGKLAALGREIAVQGELVGPGMNGNRDLLPEREFRVFRIWDIANGRYLGSTERRELCACLGLPHVKVIAPAMDVFSELPTVDAVLKFAEGATDRGHEREGLVFKEADNAFPRSFKAVSNRYLLKLK